MEGTKPSPAFFVHTTELAVGTIWSVWRGVCESVSVVDGAFVSLIAWVYRELHLNSLKKKKRSNVENAEQLIKQLICWFIIEMFIIPPPLTKNKSIQ